MSIALDISRFVSGRENNVYSSTGKWTSFVVYNDTVSQNKRRTSYALVAYHRRVYSQKVLVVSSLDVGTDVCIRGEDRVVTGSKSWLKLG